jgi:ABC-2 type transport system ATP-binding protein
MIELINLTKKFGTLTAVDNLNLRIATGEIFGFLGPNGAGKTTTIKMMVGLLKPTVGTVMIGGRDISKEPLKVKKIIGYIPDRSFLYEKLTAREFLQFVAGIFGFTKKQSSDKINSLLRLFGLEEWEDELIESFSQGMRQRLVLSSALVHNPKVIIVDEPVVGLDPKGSRLVKTVFKNLTHAGVTVFLSTHVLEIAEELCDRIAIIQEGKVIALGTMDELQNKVSSKGQGLESLFLRLTGGEEVSESIDALKLPVR